MPPWRDAVVRWIPAALFVLLPVVLVYPGFLPGKILFGTDLIGGFYHLRGAIGAALAEGRLPVWDPHTRCGAPLLASLHGGVLYPATWPAAILDPGLFWTLTAWLHLSLSGAFAFAWLGRGLGLSRGSALAGALLFMLCGFMALHVHHGHVPHISAFPWAAAVMGRLERFLTGPTLRRGMILAAALALMLLAGFPQFVYIAGFAVLARLVHFVLADREGRKERAFIALRAVGALGLAGVLAAPQLLPTVELIGHTQRAAAGDRFDFVSSYSMPPPALVAIAAPQGLGDADSSPFIGIAALGLAALGALGRGRGRWMWIGLALLGLVLAMGKYTPLFRVLYEVLPGVGFFRVPARFLLIFVIAAAALTAMGVERLIKGDDVLRRHATVLAAVAAALLAPAIGYGQLWTSLALGALTVVLVLHRQSILGGGAAAAALGVLLLAELVGHNSVYFKSYPRADMEWPAEFVTAVKNHPQYPFRIATVTAAQTPAIGKSQLAGIDHVGGYDPMMLRRYTEACNVARGKPASDMIIAMALARPGPLFDLMGARLWIVPGARQEPPGWKTVGQLPSGFVYENPKAMPRAFLVGRGTAIESSEERLKALADPTFDPRRVVILESAADAAPSGPSDVQGTVQLGAMKAGHYEFRTQSEVDAYLVLTEGYFPGWTVEVDGAPGRILPANHLFQAVRLPAGSHNVRFTYRSRFLGLGFALAAAGLLIPLAVVFLRRRSTAASR